MITTLTQAVTNLLNATSFTQTFTAARVYLPVYDLATESGYKVQVYPVELVQSSLTRANVQADAGMGIVIQKKVDQTKPAEIDACVALLEEIAAYLRTASVTNQAWLSSEILAIYDADNLKNSGVYTGAIKIIYRSLEAR